MAQFSEVLRIEAAIRNKSGKELEWALWYCRMRQAVPSARPADLRYWSGMEEKVSALLAPPVEMKVYPAKKKRRVGRGLGMGPVGDESGL
jgi:ribosomal protein L13E